MFARYKYDRMKVWFAHVRAKCVFVHAIARVCMRRRQRLARRNTLYYYFQQGYNIIQAG